MKTFKTLVKEAANPIPFPVKAGISNLWGKLKLPGSAPSITDKWVNYKLSNFGELNPLIGQANVQCIIETDSGYFNLRLVYRLSQSNASSRFEETAYAFRFNQEGVLLVTYRSSTVEPHPGNA